MKRTVRLTESNLRHIISESVKKILNEVEFNTWSSSNDDAVQTAINLLSQAAIKEIVGDDVDFLKNATDLQKCDYFDIQLFFSIDNSDIWDIVERPFSIKKVNKKYDYFSVGDVFEDFVKDNFQYVLPPDLIEKLYDRQNVASITHSDYYGGGSFEVMRDIELGTAKKITQTIKQMAQQ